MSPAPPTRARVTPAFLSTSSAACDGIPLGNPADVELHARRFAARPCALRDRAPSGPSRRAYGLRQASMGPAACRSRRARRQSRPTGAIVTSNAPPDRSYIDARQSEHIEEVCADLRRGSFRPIATASRARFRGRNRSRSVESGDPVKGRPGGTSGGCRVGGV